MDPTGSGHRRGGGGGVVGETHWEAGSKRGDNNSLGILLKVREVNYNALGGWHHWEAGIIGRPASVIEHSHNFERLRVYNWGRLVKPF